MKHIASCSGGKDSVATLIVAKEINAPLDEVVYCEVMFDAGTSAEHPEHLEFIHNKLKPFVENELQVPFVHLRSKKTYVDFFKHKITRGEHTGKTHGFPIAGMCAINRDCKIPPIRNYWKAQGTDVVQYIGIAADEPKRLDRLKDNQVSLLGQCGITEKDAATLCLSYGLLSPIYNFTNRNGCWFCMNCKDEEWRRLITKHGRLFDKLLELEAEYPERYRNNLTRTETPTQLQKRIEHGSMQYSLFD
jgi:hypothetical protein